MLTTIKNVQCIPATWMLFPFRREITFFAKRCFSNNSYPSALIGPAPSQPILPGEQGYDLFLKNLQIAGQYNRGSILTHAVVGEAKNLPSQEANSIFLELMKSMKVQNAEIRQLNQNIRDLIAILNQKNS
jgi:hypothetical protein